MGAAASERDDRARRALRTFIDAEAAALGFDAVGVTTPAALPAALAARLAAALDRGDLASMHWMAQTRERRADPRVLWPDVRSILSLAMTYGPDVDPRAVHARPDRGAISVYARHRDYHDLIKGRLKQLAGRLVARAGALGLEAEVKVFVDTAPVMEKPIAAAAGIGWQGKHTNLVSRRLGSWFFLAEIFTTLDLEPDPAEPDHCGACRRCLDACPTGALPQPGRLDARRCISYLTIEHAGPIDRDLRPLIGNRIYGCDDCLAVCPWNKFAVDAREIGLRARPDLAAPPLADLVALDDAGFRALFSASPVKRIGRERFVRNVLIAIANSRDPRFEPGVVARLGDASPLVRATAAWALPHIVSLERCQALAATYMSGEAEPMVLEEWRLAIAPASA